MNRTSNADNRSDRLEKDSGLVGGIIRSILRFTGKFLKHVPKPPRVHVNISSVTEVFKHLAKYLKENERSLETKQKLQYTRALFIASPHYLRSLLLDTALFYMYERAVDKAPLTTVRYIPDYWMSLISERAVVPTHALLTGLVGGGIQGYLSGHWDSKYYATLNNSLHHKARRCLRGTAIASSLTYGSLFGVYEFSKSSMLYELDLSDNHDDLTRVEGFACVLLSGGIAGYCSEVIAHYGEAIESYGLKVKWEHVRSLPSFSVRGSSMGIFSSVIGFLAYEYTKDQFYLNE